MSKIKLESVDSNVFMVAGKAYSKGDYIVSYEESGNDANGVVEKGVEALVTLSSKVTNVPVFKKQLFTTFVDSTGAAYGDFDEFTKALNALILKGDGLATDLITDKGTVTQITTIATGVTLDASNGIVTTVASTLAADASASFTVTNSKVSATSNIQLTPEYAGAGVVHATVTSKGSGSFIVKITNVGTVALDAVIKIQFLVA